MSHLMAHFCICVSFTLLLSANTYSQVSDDLVEKPTDIPHNPIADKSSSALNEQQIRQYDENLTRIRTLVRANVVNLAERLLIEQSPPLMPNEIWFRWQQQLWALYESSQNWQALREATDSVPTDFPTIMRHYALRKHIIALIALGKSEQVRQIIRQQLIINHAKGELVQQLRQSLIESYLKQNMFDDANRAMQLYEIEYRNNSVEWNQLRARILIEKQQYNEAINSLAAFNDIQSSLIKLEARLKLGDLSPKQVQQQLRTVIGDDQAGYSIRYYAYDIAVQAAQISADLETIVSSLEEQLGFVMSPKAANQLNSDTTVTVTDIRQKLMQAYHLIAQEQANNFGLLLDDSDKLVALAVETESTVVKRALYVQVLTQAADIETKKKASDKIVASLITDNRSQIVPILFRSDTVGLGQFYLLADTHLSLLNTALSREDLRLAAFVTEQITQVPEGVEEARWQLQNARIAILTNNIDTAQDYLNQWFNQNDRLTPDRVDQMLQPLFDLQKIKRHDLALTYFERLYSMNISSRHKREIAFWLAESYEATDELVYAADYYLSSAMMQNNGFDQWGEAARFRAADCLLSLGLYDDARNLFEGLLKRTENVQRQSQLNQKLQDLQLLQSTGTKSIKKD